MTAAQIGAFIALWLWSIALGLAEAEHRRFTLNGQWAVSLGSSVTVILIGGTLGWLAGWLA